MEKIYIYQVVEDREMCHPVFFSTLEEAQKKMIHDFMDKMRYNMDDLMSHFTEEFSMLPEYMGLNKYFVYYVNNVGITSTIPDNVKNVYIGDQKTYEEMIYEILMNPFEGDIDPLWKEGHWSIDTHYCFINPDKEKGIFYDYDARIFSIDKDVVMNILRQV